MRIAISVLLLALTVSGCLKTRAQLRNESGDPLEGANSGQSVTATVQDVHPEGEYVIDEIKSEITRLTGRVEDLERSAQEGKKQDTEADREQIRKLEQRIAELEQAQMNMLEAIKKMQTEKGAESNPIEFFEKGKGQFAARNHEAAIESLSTYLKNPKGGHVQEATFMRAEAYFETKQYKKAIIDFSKFPEKYHKSPKMPAALLKIGQAFEALGMTEDAKGFYQELVDKFPKSAEAKRVKIKLK